MLKQETETYYPLGRTVSSGKGMVCGRSEQTVENMGLVPWQEGSQEA